MTPELENIQDRITGLVRRAIKQLEDWKGPEYTRQQVQSIESLQKTLLIIDNMSQGRKVEDEMDKKSENELKDILGFSDGDD